MKRISIGTLMATIALAAIGLAVVKNAGHPLFLILVAVGFRLIGERILGRE
jgi:hypothetical protein